MKLEDFFFWLEAPYKVIWLPLWWLILSTIVFFIPGVRLWWWLIVPLILAAALKDYYLWWIGWDHWYSQLKWVTLELIPPKEMLAPLSAMEDIFSLVWGIFDKPNFREKWVEGELPLGPFWCSWEIASIEGKIHFYVRCLTNHRHIIESAIYSYYPEVEIKQVADYTKNVPQNIPNKEWDLAGEDYVLAKENAYPIKTYPKFFEPQGERISQEEKRVDPIISLLEDMSRLGPGEQFWCQFITTPIVDADIPWRKEAKKIITKIAKRPEKKEKTLFDEVYDMISTVIGGLTAPSGEGVKSIPPEKSESGEKEMVITPGEREVLSAIEDKIKKPAYKTVIRGIYLAKRKSLNSDHGKILRAYMNHFGTSNLNYIRFNVKTRTKVHFVLRKTRKYLRARKLFIFYVHRFPPLYPKMAEEGAPIFNTEELATMFHFPTKISGLVVPTASAVEAKKGAPPSNLPIVD